MKTMVEPQTQYDIYFFGYLKYYKTLVVTKITICIKNIINVVLNFSISGSTKSSCYSVKPRNKDITA